MISKVLLSDFHRSRIKTWLNFRWKRRKMSGISILSPFSYENESKQKKHSMHHPKGREQTMKLTNVTGLNTNILYKRQLGLGPLTRLQFSLHLQSQSMIGFKFGIQCTEEPMEVEEYPQGTVGLGSGGSAQNSEEENCVICMDDITNKVVLDKCSHAFCRDCIALQFKYKASCPVCGTVYGKITGNQPAGTIHFRRVKSVLPGYEGCGVISVSYSFPDGTQTAEHQNPGHQYYGTSRTGYLPDCLEGLKVAKMLKVAFDRRLVFTVGRSRTTGADNVVTWNDIHHKTSFTGGPENFGYPDPTYLSRVQEELAAKGVTEADTHGIVLNIV